MSMKTKFKIPFFFKCCTSEYTQLRAHFIKKHVRILTKQMFLTYRVFPKETTELSSKAWFCWKQFSCSPNFILILWSLEVNIWNKILWVFESQLFQWACSLVHLFTEPFNNFWVWTTCRILTTACFENLRVETGLDATIKNFSGETRCYMHTYTIKYYRIPTKVEMLSY